MKIETIADWNMVLAGCGCCEMPSCPVPTRECESITVEICGHVLPEHEENEPGDECRRFATKTTTRVIDYFEEEPSTPSSSQQNYTGTYVSSKTLVDGECITSWATSSTYSDTGTTYVAGGAFTETTTLDWTSSSNSDDDECVGGGTYTLRRVFDDPEIEDEFDSGDWPEPVYCPLEATPSGTWTKSGFSYTDPSNTYEVTNVTYSGEIVAAEYLEAFSFPDDANGVSCVASTGCAIATKSRFRWIIPDTWPGSYFKITWDEVFFPDDESTPTVVNANRSWTWEGPGDPEDEDTWKSGWYSLAPPEAPGEVRVVNIRYECYKSAKFGTRPQITGEAYEIPE
jgi:hypothetical protein